MGFGYGTLTPHSQGARDRRTSVQHAPADLVQMTPFEQTVVSCQSTHHETALARRVPVLVRPSRRALGPPLKAAAAQKAVSVLDPRTCGSELGVRPDETSSAQKPSMMPTRYGLVVAERGLVLPQKEKTSGPRRLMSARFYLMDSPLLGKLISSGRSPLVYVLYTLTMELRNAH